MTSETNNGGTAETKRWLGIAQFAVIILVIAVALYFARAPARVDRGPIAVAGNETPVVEIFKPELSEHVLRINLTGTVTLDRIVKVVSEVTGRVVWVSPDFVNGGWIPANTVFIKVDPTEYELGVEAAEMALREAEAEFQRVRQNADTLEDVGIALASARLGKAEVELELARLQVSRTEISLPYSAWVIASELEVGSLIGPQDDVGRSGVLGSVFRPEALQVRVPIDVKDLEVLNPAIGRAARVRTSLGTFDAELARVAAVVTPETRLAKVFLKFSGHIAPDLLPAPGTFAEVEIFGPRLEGVFILPESAAREQDNVWIVEENALRSLAPTTLRRAEEGWVVEEFDSGEGVVVGVLSGAREGLAVSARPPSPE
ncbi:MAG: hypothetical protein OXN84_21380 [Albidovulum sp.]|nr:hypothetical protein [Albidovulum sp.]